MTRIEKAGSAETEQKGKPYKENVFGITVGLGYIIPVGDAKLFLELRYRRLLQSLFKEPEYVNNIGAKIGYGFSF